MQNIETIKLKLTDIQEYANNPRKNDEAVKYVAESIKQCGYIAPIIVDESYVILAGHTRLKALKRLGYKECECIIRTGLTEEQKKKYRILDNKTNEFAQWDYEKLEIELQTLDFDGIDIDWGLPEEEKDIEEDNYEPIEVEEPKAKYGDVYQLGNHRLMCGDSTNQADVDKLMNGNLADMVMTDPPYNVNISNSEGMTIQNDNMSEAAFINFLTDAFSCLNNALKVGGGILHLVR